MTPLPPPLIGTATGTLLNPRAFVPSERPNSQGFAWGWIHTVGSLKTHPTKAAIQECNRVSQPAEIMRISFTLVVTKVPQCTPVCPCRTLTLTPTQPRNKKTRFKHQRYGKCSSKDLRQKKKCQRVFGVHLNELVFEKMRHDRELVQVLYLNRQSQVKNSGANWVTEMLACLLQQTFLAQIPKRPRSPFSREKVPCMTDWGSMRNLLWSDDCCADIAAIHYPGSSNEQLRKDAVKMRLGEVHKCLATCWCTSTVFNGQKSFDYFV